MSDSKDIKSFADNFIPVIDSEDPLLHTNTHPFCSDETCGCHEDQSLIAPIQQAYQDGLVTSSEATNIVNGKTL